MNGTGLCLPFALSKSGTASLRAFQIRFCVCSSKITVRLLARLPMTESVFPIFAFTCSGVSPTCSTSSAAVAFAGRTSLYAGRCSIAIAIRRLSISSQADAPVSTIIGTAFAILSRESNSSCSNPLAFGNGTVRSVILVNMASVPSEPAIRRARFTLPS